MSKYQNYTTYLTENGYTVSTSPEEFAELKSITFVCLHGHSTTLKATSFGNKKNKVSKPVELCSDCHSTARQDTSLISIREEIKTLTGHLILSMKDKHHLTYQCGRCGKHNQSNLSSLKRNTGICSKCQGESSRNCYQYISSEVEKSGFYLLWTPEDYDRLYSDKDIPLSVKCPCGRNAEMRLHDIKSGKKCMGCRNERSSITSMEKYGVPNPAMSSEVKAKIVSSNMAKHGVSYPQQNPDILTKTKETCREKFGKDFAFNQDWVYEKIRETHTQKWGFPFPLQSKVVQRKVEATCQEKLGVRRPLICKEIFEKTRETMMKIYNTRHPLQVPEFFHKAMKSAFSKKQYHFPSGRVEEVMGYEPYVLDHLLRKIDEACIFVGDKVPDFNYTDETGKRRKYYPDIFIAADRIIEVKSTWTFNLCPLTNFAKMTEVARQGFTSELYLVHKKRVWDIIKYTSDRALSNRHKKWDGRSIYPMEKGDEPSEEDIEIMVEEVIKEEIVEAIEGIEEEECSSSGSD